MKYLPVKPEKQIKLVFSIQAWVDIWNWINSTQPELGVLGMARRFEDEDGILFKVSHPYVPYQTATAAHWEVDQTKHASQLFKRIKELGPDAAKYNKFHLHSHPGGGTSPSAGGDYGDMSVRERETENFSIGEPDDYKIYMIGSSGQNFSLEIYDYGSGMIYDRRDVDVYIGTIPLQRWSEEVREHKQSQIEFNEVNIYGY